VGIETHREVEHKYDASGSDVLPTWTDLDMVGTVDPPVELDLKATYFDTADLSLARADITLRRRSGGEDDGWHLKLPVRPGDRRELRVPFSADLGDGSVPHELAELVQGRLRGRACAPIATLGTHRTLYRLRDRAGELVAEVCDDRVTAHVHEQDGSVSTQHWREWEVEGAEVPRAFASELEKALIRASARPASRSSKLARALGSRLPHHPDLVEREPTEDGPAAVVLLAHIRAQVDELLARDPQVRTDQPDAVHKMRVATRRLRSALATFKSMLASDVASSLRDELKWLGRALGEARDSEVLRDRLAGLAADEPSELGSVAVARDLADRMQRRYDEGLAHARLVLSSPRYFRLLDALDALAQAPPWTERAARPADKILRKLADREWKRLAARAKAAEHRDSVTDREVLLHEVRKSAKRLRYACEAVASVLGSSATELAEAAENLQETLGEHQDSVVSQQVLRDLARNTTLAGEDALIYGRLHLREENHAEQARARYASAVDRVLARRPRQWPKHRRPT